MALVSTGSCSQLNSEGGRGHRLLRGTYTRVSLQSPTARPAVTTKATTLSHWGTSAPSTVTLQPNNSRNACTMATNAKITRVAVVKGFMALPPCDEAFSLAWAARFPKRRAST
jgi:hypothetical protein